MSADGVIERTEIPGFPVRRGKVRDVYDLDDHVLLVATDRISAYDVVMPTAIPGKGRELTRVSKNWFEVLASAKPHHMVRVVEDDAPAGLEEYVDQLRGRATLCVKADVVPIECIVRGYLAGSGWAEYCESGTICGIELPAGMQQCQQLPEPIFTPSTKAAEGHDENISFEQACEIVGADTMDKLRARSLAIYNEAWEYASKRGIIIADTKFEFGMRDGEFLLIDEVLTPDSSRFWPVDKYEAGRDQESFDKQYLRNYLTELVNAGIWDKTSPGPDLPDEIVKNTVMKYAEVCRLLIQ